MSNDEKRLLPAVCCSPSTVIAAGSDVNDEPSAAAVCPCQSDNDDVDPYLAGFRDCRREIFNCLNQHHHHPQQQQQQPRPNWEPFASPTTTNTPETRVHLSWATDDDVTKPDAIASGLVDSLCQHLLEREHQLRVSATHLTSSTPWKQFRLPTSCDITNVSGNDDELRRSDEVHSISHGPFNDSALGTSFEAAAVAIDDSEMVGVADDELDGTQKTELSENAAALMRLACNNPDVGRLLNELFELMDYSDDDVIDSDEELNDDGVHELSYSEADDDVTNNDSLVSVACDELCIL